MSKRRCFHYRENVSNEKKAWEIRDFDLVFDVGDREVILDRNGDEFGSFAESEEIESVIIEELALGAEELPILF